MLIAGLQKTTLVDFPGKVAATVFTRGCNFRCGFCHNPELVLPHRYEGTIPEGEFFRFLESRLGKLTGVCITGGEPLVWPDTDKFISHIKALGFAVKLDTNGSFPDRLEKIIKDGDVDYIAMDIKAPFSKYESVANNQFSITNSQSNPKSQMFVKARSSHASAPHDNETMNQRDNEIIDYSSELIENIKRSISLIMNSGLDYEFRTTVAKPLLEPEDFKEIGKMIRGAKRYYIQNFVQSKHIEETKKFSPFTEDELAQALALVSESVIKAEIR